MLNNWLNTKYLDTKPLHGKFTKAKPFPYLELREFFKPDIAVGLLAGISKEGFSKKESDLFSFMQTNDLTTSPQGLIKNFHSFLCSPGFLSFMEKIAGIPLGTHIDLHATLYQDTDFLLCHDDRLDSRKIAFLLYLSDFEEGEGGSLNLFTDAGGMPGKVAKKIIPRFNTFAFFEVSNISFHEVEEVIAEKQRITLGGWFHDPATLPGSKKSY